MYSSPGKKLAFLRNLNTPNELREVALDQTQELELIGRASRVTAVGGPFPSDQIIFFRELDRAKNLP